MYEIIQNGMSFTKTITMETEICCNCGIPFAIPSDFRSNLLNDSDKWFYCPNGHRQHYSESRETKLRKEAEAALHKKEEELSRMHNRLLSETIERQKQEKLVKKGQRDLKRLNNGVCSCCNRTFSNLAKHIKTQHPELVGKVKPIRKSKTKIK
jgi:hypothetical protein